MVLRDASIAHRASENKRQGDFIFCYYGCIFPASFLLHSGNSMTCFAKIVEASQITTYMYTYSTAMKIFGSRDKGVFL